MGHSTGQRPFGEAKRSSPAATWLTARGCLRKSKNSSAPLNQSRPFGVAPYPRLISKWIVSAAAIFAAVTSAVAKDGVGERSCETKFGGQVVCGDFVNGITIEQYEAGLNKRAEEIRAEEAEKRVQLQRLLEAIERAADAEKDGLRSQIETLKAEKRALEAEGKNVAERLENLQASYNDLTLKVAEANAALTAFAPLISKEAFEQAQAMLRRGDVSGAEGKFVEIADAVRKIRDRADEVGARAIFQAGQLAMQRVDWRAAYVYFTRAVSLQPGNWLYADEAGNLARELGNFAAAITLNEAALNIAISTFGADAPKTATSLNNLSLTYTAVARYAEAEALCRRAIEIGEKTLGQDDPVMATRYGNLALALKKMGKYPEAEPLYRRAIEIDEKALGRSHSNLARADLARGYNNLAVLLKEQRKYPEAESLYRQAIEINKTAFGTDHPRVATGYNNLALVLNEEGALVLNGQDKFAEGESLIRQAIEITEKTLGKEHYTIAFEYNTLALLLENEHKYAEAESRFRRAIEIGKKTLGEDHPDVATWYENLAGLLQIWGEHVEAEALYLQAFEIFQAKFGPENPNTVRVKSKYDSLRRLNDKPLNSAR